MRIVASLLLSAVGAQAFSLEKNRPVARVVSILKDMQSQLQQDSRDDEGVYDSAVCFCQENTKNKNTAVEAAKQKITSLISQIDENTAAVSRLGQEIDDHKMEVASKKKSLAEATSIRQKELATFNEEEKDMIQSVTALKAAIEVLSKHHTKEALVKVSKMVRREVMDKKLTGVLTNSQRRLLNSVLIQQTPYDSPIGDGSYTSQSGEIFGILRQMLETFQGDRSADQLAEANKQKAYNDLKGSLLGEITAATKSKENKLNERAKATEALQIARDDKEATENTLSADEKFLLNLEENCGKTDVEYGERQSTRAEEIKAISEAILILGSDDARDNFTKTFKAASFMQIRAHSSNLLQKNTRERASALLHSAALKSLHPAELEALSVAVKLNAFAKVKAAIDGLINDLKLQQLDEVKERDVCIDSFNQNEKSHIQSSHEKEKLDANIEFSNSEIERLQGELDEHDENIKELDSEMKKAGENREKQNAEFQKVIHEQQVTLQLLRDAVVVLAKVYRTDEQKAIAASNALLQQDPKPAPTGFDTYEKKQGGGVLGLLNTIITDTAQMKKEAILGEQDSQKNYEVFIQDSNVSKDAEEQAVIAKTEQKANIETTRDGDQTILDGVTGELLRLESKNQDFHLQCDFLTKNFDIRQEARGEEIDALNTAKAILSGSKFD